MKTAVCLYGKSTKFSSSIVDHAIRPNGADVYAHTWSGSCVKDLLALATALKVDPVIPFDIPDINFEKSLADGYSGGCETTDGARKHVFNTCSMWYSVLQSYLLCYQNHLATPYDYIIFSRYDAVIHQPIVVDRLDKKSVYGEFAGKNKELLLNWVVAGGAEEMSHYGLMYFKLMHFYKTYGIWVNEFNTLQIMKENNVPVHHFGHILSLDKA